MKVLLLIIGPQGDRSNCKDNFIQIPYLCDPYNSAINNQFLYYTF
jgi:hypothetical protein